MSYLLSIPRLSACANAVAVERRIAIERQLTPYSEGSLNEHDRRVLELELAETWAAGYAQAKRDHL